MWVKGHKDIEGNEMADKLSKRASILGHESEGVVTPAGLRAWARRVRAEARGGTETAYWDGVVRPYLHIHGADQTKDHRTSGYTRLARRT